MGSLQSGTTGLRVTQVTQGTLQSEHIQSTVGTWSSFMRVCVGESVCASALLLGGRHYRLARNRK